MYSHIMGTGSKFCTFFLIDFILTFKMSGAQKENIFQNFLLFLFYKYTKKLNISACKSKIFSNNFYFKNRRRNNVLKENFCKDFLRFYLNISTL